MQPKGDFDQLYLLLQETSPDLEVQDVEVAYLDWSQPTGHKYQLMKPEVTTQKTADGMLFTLPSIDWSLI
ncbi:MAG: hypothetical protein ACXVDB_03790, partial [Tumebacillaceae bacterium]